VTKLLVVERERREFDGRMPVEKDEGGI